MFRQFARFLNDFQGLVAALRAGRPEPVPGQASALQLLARSATSSRDEIEGWLAGATRLLGVDPPAAGASVEELGAVAALLRSRLGPARPVFRPGR